MKQFTDKELSIIANIINVASQKGLFTAGDMQSVGELFNKIIAQLPKPESTDDGKK